MKVCIVTHKNLVNRSWIIREKDMLEDLGFSVDIIGIPDELPSPFLILQLKKYLKRLRTCQIVVAWFAFPSSIFLCKMLGIPAIANAVGYEVAFYPEILYGMPRNYIARSLISLGLKMPDAIIAISRESLRWAYKWSGRRGFVIYEGIDINHYDCSYIEHVISTKKNPIIITISFLGITNVIRKDLATLIKALSLVKRKHPNVKLYIIGEKMEGYPILRRLAKELGVERNIVFTGKLPHNELLKILCSADMFVMTSYQEGFPTAASEVAAAGIPVIVSNRPAMNEVFTRENAVVVEPGSHIELAEAITNLLEDKELARKIAINGMNIVRTHFNIDIRKRKLAKFMLLFIKRLLQKRKIAKYYSVGIKYVFMLFLLSTVAWIMKVYFDITSGIISRFFKGRQIIKLLT